MIVRFEDGRAATMDVSWSSKGGLEGRFEVYGDAGRIVQDMTSTPLRASSSGRPATSARRPMPTPGWVFPVPDETHVHGHDAMMADVVERVPRRPAPRETFRGRARGQRDPRRRLPIHARAGRWEPVERRRGAARRGMTR